MRFKITLVVLERVIPKEACGISETQEAMVKSVMYTVKL